MLDFKKIPDTDRSDLAFQLVVAMRDTINIAKKKGYKATYENAIQLFHDFSPELYSDITSLLTQRNLSDEAKVFITRAEVESNTSEEKITPLQLLEEEIETYTTVYKKAKTEQKKVIKNKLGSLQSLRKSLKPRALTENRILLRDTSKADRTDFGATFFRENDFFVDYQISDDKFLRIRLLHPDKPEHLTGADLIYEQHDEETGKMRILFLQYKIWENGILHFSEVKNLEKQLEKLDGCICQNIFCNAPELLEGQKEYRFPYCSAFLRPTDKLQQQNEKLVSSGLHIPICSIRKFIQDGGKKLERKKIRFQTLTHEIFEQLFNKGFIGSQWIEQEYIEEFYKKYKILENDESVIFYAREIKEDKKGSEYVDKEV